VSTQGPLDTSLLGSAAVAHVSAMIDPYPSGKDDDDWGAAQERAMDSGRHGQ